MLLGVSLPLPILFWKQRHLLLLLVCVCPVVWDQPSHYCPSPPILPQSPLFGAPHSALHAPRKIQFAISQKWEEGEGYLLRGRRTIRGQPVKKCWDRKKEKKEGMRKSDTFFLSKKCVSFILLLHGLRPPFIERFFLLSSLIFSQTSFYSSRNNPKFFFRS